MVCEGEKNLVEDIQAYVFSLALLVSYHGATKS